MRISDYPEAYYREVASATLTEENRARDRFRAWQRKQAESDIRHNMVGSPQIVYSEHTATACR